MGKAVDDKRRQAAKAKRDKARRAAKKAAKANPNWYQRQNGGTQTLIVLGAIAALVGGHFLLWGAVFPALGALVGRVPVVSTVTGWLFGGGAAMAWGVYALNQDTAKPATTKRLLVVAWVWTGVALLLFPTGYADSIRLPVDFWAGVYAGAYGMVLSPVAFGVVAVGWWLLVNKLFGYKEEPSNQAVGWILVGYATLLLVWGSTLLRM
ncbi:hypothetical protein [Saccharothrix sp. NRRL B-16314]|uniref:hypothetical protein n=1 Tax=Saccharothrix sp. NRRL B-16314 TaxID=1463825 RepID=UPI0012DE6975|nr:hypothetical protein [Saccharothrix sp. NRRL B-16314]